MLRIWFRKRYGRIVDVPGLAKRNPAMEADALFDVGIQLERGPFVATVVQANNCLREKLRFVRRDDFEVTELQPRPDPFAEE